MSEGLLIAIFSVIAVAIGGLYALMFQHISHCSSHHSTIAKLQGSVERTEEEIGDHNSGIRGQLHMHASKLTEHAMRLNLLDHMEDRSK